MTGEIVLLVFPSRTVLTKALDRMAKLEYIDIRRGAIVAKAKTGETILLDDDVSPDQGGIAGGTLGATMGALGVAQLGALALPGVGPIIALGTAALVGALTSAVTLLKELASLSKGQVIISGASVNTPVMVRVRQRITEHGGVSIDAPEEWLQWFETDRLADEQDAALFAEREQKREEDGDVLWA